jgi:hypothetical protein
MSETKTRSDVEGMVEDTLSFCDEAFANKPDGQEIAEVLREAFAPKRKTRKRKSRSMDDRIDALLTKLDSLRLPCQLTRESYQHIIEAGFRGENLLLASGIASIVVENQPLTLRSVFYQVVSAGLKPSTDKIHYKAVGRVLKRLRRNRILSYSWIVDSMRSTYKPSSWSGLTDYVETIQDAYRKDFWRELPNYVHVIAEKDAIAGVLHPVTDKYDVRLSPLRGYASDSFVYSIAETWNRIDKPIHVAYFGDFDPSGMNIEQDCNKRLRELCNRDFTWVRLGVNAEQIREFKLLPLVPKKQDRRYRRFVDEHGSHCAEVDAIPANALRGMLDRFIHQFIPQEEWERLQTVEAIEKETFANTLQALRKGA